MKIEFNKEQQILKKTPDEVMMEVNSTIGQTKQFSEKLHQ